MKTILVPIDFSPMTGAVLDTAAAFARDLHGRVILIHVVSTASFRAPYPLPAEMRTQLIFEARQAAEQHLERHAELFRKQGVEVEVECDEGDAVPAILKAVRDREADLIVLGSHGHRLLFDLLIGSTARGVLQHSHCPVLLVPKPEKQPPERTMEHG